MGGFRGICVMLAISIDTSRCRQMYTLILLDQIVSSYKFSLGKLPIQSWSQTGLLLACVCVFYVHVCFVLCWLWVLIYSSGCNCLMRFNKHQIAVSPLAGETMINEVVVTFVVVWSILCEQNIIRPKSNLQPSLLWPKSVDGLHRPQSRTMSPAQTKASQIYIMYVNSLYRKKLKTWNWMCEWIRPSHTHPLFLLCTFL